MNALRAFEACARLGSTVAAAAELGVTHGAVSKQVALLERHLGVLLFDRGGARLAPTPLGLDYAAKLGQGFDLIDAASRESALGRRDTAKVVRVSTTASLAGLWLLPLLPEFQAAHPGIEVWVAETKALVAIGREAGADVALRTGMGPWPGVRAEALLTERLVPVAAPALARRLRKPADLARLPLLHDQDPRAGWQDWLEHAGLGRPAWGDRGPRLADGALLLQAARAGQGVALTRRRLAGLYLRNRWLVEPFGPALDLGPDYWLVLPRRGTPSSRATRLFAEWLRAVARREADARP